jgi:hypothetical protein
MSLIGSTRARVITGLTAGAIVILGGGGAAWAAATGGTPASHTSAPTTATAAPGSTSTTHPRAMRARGLGATLARADHATVEIKRGGQWVTVTYDQGTVTAVSPSAITLRRPDGQSTTLTVSSTTKFAGVSSANAVQLNKPARVVSQNGTALRVAQRKPNA